MRKLKLILASLAIALCGFSQAFAADWSAATLEAGKHYFLNVGANKWWGAGNSWGTQASLLPHPEYLTLVVDGSNYKVESQVSNGGANYYFNGSFMDNGSPVSLTIETDGTNYSIANGTTYYGFDGTSTVLATSDNRDSDNFKWQIFNEAQMRARLEAASSSNPVDATYLILDQGFSRNQRNKSAWTMDASNKNLGGGDNTNMCAESWHSTFTLSQKLENVPNGLYTLTAQGFYRQDGSDNDNLPYFYINDAKGTFPILSGSENNMTDASNSFTAGKYTISPISVLVTDGTITLGAKNEVNTSLWCIFDNFVLTFYGDTDPLEASKNQIKTSIDEAEAIDVTGLPTAVVDEMKTVIDSYKAAYESYTTKEEFDNAIAAIQKAVNKVKAYNNAKACIAELKALLEATNVYTKAAYDAFYANVTKFENAELTTEEANALNAKVFGTRGWRATVDVDDFLISAWGVAPRTWDGELHVNTWSTEGDNDGSNFVEPFLEYWTGDGEVLAAKTMTATVPGLKAGQEYEVSALVRVRNSDGKTIVPGTILFQVGEGASVDVTAGTQIGTSPLYIGTYTAKGTADAEGNLVIKFNVAEGSNVSWFAFKNVKYAESITEPVVELTHTASSYCGSDANVWNSTVDAEKEHINNAKTSGTWNGFAYADFSILLPHGHSIKSASLAWSGIGSSKDRTTDVMYVNAGEQLDYEALAAGNAKVSLGATKIATVTFKKSATTDFTTDVTDAVKTILEAGQSNIIFKFTSNPGGGDLVGKGAAEKAPVLTVETVSADQMTKYTVVAMLDADTLKVASYDVLIGETATASAADMAAFKNEDGSKKYIYVGGNTEITTVKDSASNIITLVFREAEKWTYTVNAVDAEGNVISELMASSDFEGETVTVPYNQYILKDSVLYSAEANNKEYNLTVSLGSNEFVKSITYSATSINNVVFFSEAEDVWGMTKTTSGNANIRCSNSAGAFNGNDSEVSLTTLTPGVYTIVAQVWGNAGTDLKVACGNDTLVVSTAGYILSGNKSFTVRKATEVTIPALTGNENRCFDWIYIQKTGTVPPTEVANIAALKDVEDGVEVKLALTDAVVNLWSGSGQSMASYVEDATGAIKFDMGLSNMEWMRDSIAMNGYVYASYGKDYDGIPQLSVSDSTIASKVDTVAAVPTSKVMTVADASTESAISRYVKFEKVEFAKKVIDDWGTTECYLVQGTDTITFFDKFSLFGWGAMPDFKSFDEVQGFISMYDGKFEFYPYGEYKANYTPAVVVENIAAAKAVENGTNVNLTLKDAKITAYLPSKWGGSATAFIEDASGAIQIAGDVLSQFGVENDSTILNGNIYVKYVNEWGSIQLSAGDSLAFSKVEAKEGAVSPTTMAVKDIKAETNVARYVEIAFPSFKYDAENYFYYAAQNGDTIMVVDNFGWMNSNFADNEGNIILPDSVSSIRGIVMWDDWNGYSISPTGIDEFVAPQDIVVNVAEGDIAAAVETAKATVKKVGKITINLTEGAAYTVNSSIVAPAALVINGNGATVDATALDAPFIALSKEPTAELINNYYRVDSVMISNVRVDSIKNSIFYDNGTQYCVVDFTIDNSVLNLATTAVQNEALVSFKQGGAKDFNIKNSTVYGNGVAKYFIRYNNSARLDRYGYDKNTEFQTMNYQNNTFYNVIQTGGQWGNYNGISGQNYSKFDVQNNIWYNCGTNVIRRMAGGRFSGNNPMTFAKNTYFYNDADNSAVEASYDNSGDILTSNPGFKDAANGDFTLDAASDQNINKTGDPRWFAAAPAPSVAYLCGSTTAPDEAIYNALVAAQYDVTPLNYDDVTLTEEIVMNDFAGKYDVVVLAGGTGSGTNLAKSANILLGKVNVLSTKSFWYKHYGTNGTNPGSADNPSINMVKTVAAHPIFTGIEGDEFAVFNVMEDRTSGRYLQGNGSFADEAYAQTTIATTLGADCIGEAWAGDYGYVIIPVDGAQPEGYLTEDGKKLFVNAVQYLIDGVKFTTGIDGINSNVNVLNGDVYSINGIKVRKAGESLKGLAKGLYIVNGKKFIVK